MSSEGSESTLKQITSLKRLSQHGSLAALLLYMPLGLVLGLIRCFIFLHICLLFLLLPDAFPLKRWILQIMLTVIGLPITTQGKARLEDSKKIIISNHISNLDPFILTLLHRNCLAVESPSLLSKNMPSNQLNLPANKDHSATVKILKDNLKDCKEPVLFFPEKVKTNGSRGILKFSLLPFETDHPIQPVAIQAKRLLFDVNISTSSSSIVEDLLWCLVLPFTLFNIKYLPVTEKKKEETYEEFANRVQANMAKSLNVEALPFCYTDISLYLKELDRSKVNSSETAAKAIHRECKENLCKDEASQGFEFERMLMQVKDVLPDTPVDCIKSELKKTRDVDKTITNILEGKVDFSSASKEKSSVLGQKSLSDNQAFKASKFEGTAKARQLSFVERKQAMLEAARLKYRIKHGL